MLFNSIDFAVFLPIVFSIYWFITNKSLNLQNLFVLIVSYIFYGWWDWRFLILIFFSTLVDFSIGKCLKNETNQLKRKIYLITSITVNLGLLGFFKYYNFFAENFMLAFSFFGNDISLNTINVVLPVGISFYTFQTLSYSIDVYRRKLSPTTDFIAFSAFVSFFPQLVAGPIERATNLLPQFYIKRTFNYAKAVDGMRQILWGLVKKVVIADNCAEVANHIFNHSDDYSGITLLLGAISFSFQIYGDFSGYSDIAIGTSRLFGFDLKRNFAFPYFSRDIAEFWRRWHISLSTWFRDYLYFPLGGSRNGTWLTVRNTFIIFLVSGFWHGANWTFVVWGLVNALYFLPLLLLKKNRNHLVVVAEGRLLPSFSEFFSITRTFLLTVIAWVFFRADSIEHALNYLTEMCFNVFDSNGYLDTFNLIHWNFGYAPFVLLIVFNVIEWRGRDSQFAIQHLFLKRKPFIRRTFYFLLIFSLFMFSGKTQEFIYFQF
jgi:D-alanyl-lipoteichoic acid acyltransferase DltB (MBOAT superfamily)